MKLLFFLLGASSLAFGQNATTALPQASKNIATSNNTDLITYRSSNDQIESELSVTYESKKLKKAQAYSSDGKLLQTSTKSLVNEKRLNAGEYLIKVDFQDGTSTSAKFIKK